MFIAISVNGETFDSTVADWPQTAPGFVVIDEASHHYGYIDNDPATTHLVDALLEMKTAVLITGRIAKATANAVQSAGIDIFLAAGMTLLEALNAYKSRRLEELSDMMPTESLSQTITGPAPEPFPLAVT
ncbi:NifB/NifX family molybdenum-iron cluster-binding protein [Desulfovibrio inopinatus]|uniref:NifB/NifX family molybdenum-iron cluster-binding protein n=1 Tax=Desulfovibrio inopinatus TaxID=102109 RepID=UPI0004032CC9|nr:NifB/NifX family molybdenum-iron cluster-binding protein [Desulfovibrio inopinatus]